MTSDLSVTVCLTDFYLRRVRGIKPCRGSQLSDRPTTHLSTMSTPETNAIKTAIAQRGSVICKIGSHMTVVNLRVNDVSAGSLPCCGQPATAQSESLRVEHHPQPTLTRTASLSLGDTPTRPLTLARDGGSAEQAYGGRETPERVPTGVPLESLEGTQG